MENSHKRANNLDELEINGEQVSDPEVIKDEILQYYTNLYTETETWRPGFNYLDCPKLTDEEAICLQRPFEEEEVLAAIRICAY